VYQADYGGAGDWGLPGGVGGDGSVERKRFFFEKKKQKTFANGWPWRGCCRILHDQEIWWCVNLNFLNWPEAEGQLWG
jgi:hypothetical protein